ncbi:MAG: hypothetical protein ACFFBP_17810 [Promethearchaeota archaeon]
MSEEIEKNIKFFKLSYSGLLIEPKVESEEDKLELFNINNVIAVHVKDKKRMYIWVGKHSTQSLQYYISKIRAIISREYSDLVTLRYIHTDSGSEIPEFFDSTELSKDKLHDQLKFQEKILAPKVSEISDLKNMADEYFMAEDYDKVIEISQKIIELADELGDEGLKKDQKEFINEAQQRAGLKKIMLSAEQESEEINKQFIELINTDKIIDAHDFINAFKSKYEEIDLSSIPKIDEILTNEKQIWKAFLTKQDDLINEINVLEKKIFTCIEKQDIAEAEKSFKKVKALLEKIIDETIQNKWKDIEQTVMKSRADYDDMIQNSKNTVKQLQEIIKKNEENNELELLIENCQNIITHLKLVKDNALLDQYSQLLEESLEKKRLNNLVEVIDDLRKESKIKLNEGNLIECLKYYDKILNQLKDFMN